MKTIIKMKLSNSECYIKVANMDCIELYWSDGSVSIAFFEQRDYMRLAFQLGVEIEGI